MENCNGIDSDSYCLGWQTLNLTSGLHSLTSGFLDFHPILLTLVPSHQLLYMFPVKFMEVTLLKATAKALQPHFPFVNHVEVQMLLQPPVDHHGFVWCLLPWRLVVWQLWRCQVKLCLEAFGRIYLVRRLFLWDSPVTSDWLLRTFPLWCLKVSHQTNAVYWYNRVSVVKYIRLLTCTHIGVSPYWCNNHLCCFPQTCLLLSFCHPYYWFVSCIIVFLWAFVFSACASFTRIVCVKDSYCFVHWNTLFGTVFLCSLSTDLGSLSSTSGNSLPDKAINSLLDDVINSDPYSACSRVFGAYSVGLTACVCFRSISWCISLSSSCWNPHQLVRPSHYWLHDASTRWQVSVFS